MNPPLSSKITMELHPNEAALINRIRNVFRNSEITIIAQAGVPLRIKFVSSHHTVKNSITSQELWDYIQEVTPYGEVTISNRKGQPTKIVRVMNFSDLSDGL